MIFKYIKLTNFRQYMDDIRIDFAVQNDKPITLVIANNGVGKTTLLQAFRYCFYGSSPNSGIIKLPNPDELLNNQVSKNTENGKTAILAVEIEFEHNDQRFIMRREDVFEKYAEKMIKINSKSKSSLISISKTEGAKTLNNEEADLRIRSILPIGLSNVYIFDGERVERSIDDKEFKKDLRNTIFGLLDIKKYDSLINHLGHKDKVSSVIGSLYSQITTSSLSQADEINKLRHISGSVEDTKNQIEVVEDEIEQLKENVKEFQESQKNAQININKLKERDNYRNNLSRIDKEIDSKSKELLRLGMKTLLYKEVLKSARDFSRFIQNKNVDSTFYRYLHVETINDIFERKICICGESIIPGSVHEEHLRKLYKTALPESKAQYLSYIESEIIGKAANYNDLKKKVMEINSQITKLKSEKQNHLIIIEKVEADIARLEETENIYSQVSLTDALNEKEKKDRKLGDLRNKLTNFERLEAKQKRICDPILKDGNKNRKLSFAIENLEKIKINLSEKMQTKEEEARSVLTKHFNYLISETMNGDYSTTIDEKYNIVIYNNITNQDDTLVLSTGQNVVVTLSFVMALIDTAKELSNDVVVDERYGVVMDAALSNLDELHTARISQLSLNKMDQLIFLSFKRQLRDEMFRSIEDNVGKAYELRLDTRGAVISDNLELTELNNFIHSVEDI